MVRGRTNRPRSFDQRPRSTKAGMEKDPKRQLDGEAAAGRIQPAGATVEQATAGRPV